MATPAPRCVCMTAITCAYRWEAAREGNFRVGSVLARPLSTRPPSRHSTTKPEQSAMARKADHGLPNPRTAIFRGPTFSTVTGWNRLRSEQTFLLRRGTEGSKSISLQRKIRLSPKSAFVGQEPRLSARVCAAGLASGSADQEIFSVYPWICLAPAWQSPLLFFRVPSAVELFQHLEDRSQQAWADLLLRIPGQFVAEASA